MITRIWSGYTSLENAEQYERLLVDVILPGIHHINGYRGAQLLKRKLASKVEFVTITFFDSMDAVIEFAGEDYEAAVVPPQARALLSHYDTRVSHYETVASIT